MNYYLLESIIEEYGDEKTKEMVEQYKRDLTGYILVTKIKDHLDAVDLEHPTRRVLPIPQEKLFSLLKTKVKGVNITHHSLEYIRDLWESLQNQFSLPKHILVLYRIGEGCLELTWCIPSELAAYIIQKAKEREQYFTEQRFISVTVDGVHIYTESEVSAMVKYNASHFFETTVSNSNAAYRICSVCNIGEHFDQIGLLNIVCARYHLFSLPCGQRMMKCLSLFVFH